MSNHFFFFLRQITEMVPLLDKVLSGNWNRLQKSDAVP